MEGPMKEAAELLDLEHREDPLLPWSLFVRRMMVSGGIAALIVSVGLMLGVLGYHFLGRLHWLDSLVNASMILGGMGPVDPIATTGGKWFESVYALFSGVAFLTSVSVFLAPALHRMLHKLHLETGADEQY
ncbi:MAG TPA: hypothetical protein VL123_06410 [Candidatus Udaeobacter sp.]|jgi:hypothetical protein|nr:hypothetical protein [Candidatus Udaeobacter sp.]